MCDPAEVALVGAVGGVGEGGVVVPHVLTGEHVGAVGEGGVVLGEALLGDGGGGDDQGRS